MNKTTSSNPVRLIAFFLTAIILTCTFGFTVDGWQDSTDKPGNNGDLPSDAPGGEDMDGEENNPPEDIPTDEPEIYIPEFTDSISGLETDAERAEGMRVAVVMDSTLPLYGISDATLLCEIPIENGGSRYVAFIPSDNDLWKIGSIAKTRGYISNIARYFGSAMLSLGDEDRLDYSKCDISGIHLDLSVNTGYHYNENPSGAYTNPDLLLSGLRDTGISDKAVSQSPLPFTHTEFGSERIVYSDSPANIVSINGDECKLVYDTEAMSYNVYKNGAAVVDSLNEFSPSFINCFILFADSVIYDRTDCNQMVMDTVGSGSGYYITDGGYTGIKWSAASSGIMTFYAPNGEKLVINKGAIYLSFVRSSQADKITFE